MMMQGNNNAFYNPDASSNPAAAAAAAAAAMNPQLFNDIMLDGQPPPGGAAATIPTNGMPRNATAPPVSAGGVGGGAVLQEATAAGGGGLTGASSTATSVNSTNTTNTTNSTATSSSSNRKFLPNNVQPPPPHHAASNYYAYQHSLNDPSIQENLSPFFQPFGVDVSHLPMTNPPIFQSSLAMFDDPGRRRRISISNGQISQLGEDVETVENIYNMQPPPMPNMHNHHSHPHTHSASAGFYSNTSNNTNQPPLPLQQQFNIIQQQQQQQQPPLPLPPRPSSSIDPTVVIPQDPLPSATTLHHSNSITDTGGANSNTYTDDSEGATPGTTAWKKARLLERNRIAASKCRQRKKIAQIQLQKDFDDLSGENRVLKKKLDYYEKLVSKFKKFIASHVETCDSINKESLKMVEEMLMIDSGIHEVDHQSGLVLKLDDR